MNGLSALGEACMHLSRLLLVLNSLVFIYDWRELPVLRMSISAPGDEQDSQCEGDVRLVEKWENAASCLLA